MWTRILAKGFIVFVLVKLTVVMFRRARQLGLKSTFLESFGKTGFDLMEEAFPGLVKWFVFVGVVLAVFFLKKRG
jgi:hypothetical protein